VRRQGVCKETPELVFDRHTPDKGAATHIEVTTMKNNMNSIVRQAQKMQNQISKIQDEFGNKKVEASTGGGMVTAVVNGNQELLGLKIDPEVIDPDDVALLEDMIVGAVNQAMQQAGDMLNSEIEKVTGGFNIPGMF
jgi:DNA-binding YbaB/EbfC family protein